MTLTAEQYFENKTAARVLKLRAKEQPFKKPRHAQFEMDLWVGQYFERLCQSQKMPPVTQRIGHHSNERQYQKRSSPILHPLKNTPPLVGSIKPVMIFTVVLFPEPLGPK
jgi:hypothetical protein